MFMSIFFQQHVENVPDVQSRLLFLSFSTLMPGLALVQGAIPVAFERRAVFYRERGAGTYRSVAYAVSAGLAELPHMLVLVHVAVNILYWGVGLNPAADRYAAYLCFVFLYLFLMLSTGVALAAMVPDAVSAQLASGSLFMVWNTFAGINVPVRRIPSYYLWLHYTSPIRWFLEGVVTTQFHGDARIICNPFGVPVTTGWLAPLKLCTSDGAADAHRVTGVQVSLEDFVFGDFLRGYEFERRFADLAVLVAWIALARGVAALAQAYVSHEMR